MAKSYNCLPSELLGVDHPVLAFQLNRAIWTLGRSIENDMDASSKRVKSGKGQEARRNQVLQRYLNETGSTRGQYKDPFARGR